MAGSLTLEGASDGGAASGVAGLSAVLLSIILRFRSAVCDSSGPKHGGISPPSLDSDLTRTNDHPKAILFPYEVLLYQKIYECFYHINEGIPSD